MLHRRVALVVSPLLPAATLIAIGACSSSTESTPPANVEDASADALEAATLAPVDAMPTACSLGSINTGSKVCDDCLLKSCCVVINECFDDKGCETLNGCVAHCGMTFGITDAGTQCVRDCVNVNPDAGPLYLDQSECESTRCDTDCK